MVTIYVVDHFNGKKTVNCEIQGTTTPKRHRRIKEAKFLKVVFFSTPSHVSRKEIKALL